jgi:pilus assembly protein CpaB
MNGRTALGACLVVLAILAGALFLDRSQRLVPVYAAARDLPSGTPLERGDLMVIRVRLPEVALRHYLRPSSDRQVVGRVLTAPVRRETLVPAGLVLASSRDTDLVELPVQVDPGDMVRGLRPGDSVQVLAAYTDGARRGRAVVLLPTAEVVQVLQDPTGLAGSGQERGVQLRLPGDRAPLVAAAIATARIFVVKAPGPATDPAALGSPSPDEPQPPPPGTSGPYAPTPENGQPVPTTAPVPTGTRFGAETEAAGDAPAPAGPGRTGVAA